MSEIIPEHPGEASQTVGPDQQPTAEVVAVPEPSTVETNDLAAFTRPVVAPPPVAPPAASHPQRSGGPGGKVLALVAVIALLFGAIGGGVAGGVAGYTLGDDDNSNSATATRAPNQAEDVATGSTPSSGSSVSDLVAKVNPAVVTVENTLESQDSLFGQSAGGTATGSGYIIDAQGHIVTNNHVVENATSLKVTFSDGTSTSATLVGTDPFQDVAVIKVDGALPATVSFGNSDELRAGDPVLAIGSALGEFTNTVTNGIVSATGRSLDTGDGYRLGNLIQHNAPISPGNSGGPLINMDGQVVGMNTAVVRGDVNESAEGLGFAIAGNTVKQIAQEIIDTGSAQRPYLGVAFDDAQSADQSATGGVVLTEVESGAPADQAGLKAGDVITEVDGVTIDSDNPFLNLMYQHKPGDTVSLTVEHSNGQSETVSVTLGTRPS